MVEEYIMNEETFNTMVECCKEEALEGNGSEEQKKHYAEEIEHTLNGENESQRWARLIGTDVFKRCYGEWVNIENNLCLYVEVD